MPKSHLKNWDIWLICDTASFCLIFSPMHQERSRNDCFPKNLDTFAKQPVNDHNKNYQLWMCQINASTI